MEKVLSTEEDAFSFKPTYGVGYWFRGAVEPVYVCKNPKSKSIRTHFTGMICENAKHSRKPDCLHSLIEKKFPPPYCELFARRTRAGWTTLGNECPGDGKDVRDSIRQLLEHTNAAAST